MNKKPINIINPILLALIALLLSSCREQTSQGPDYEQATVSIVPEKYLLDRLTDSSFKVNIMIPPGSSPATYDPTAGQMKALASSKIFFRNGHSGFEKGWSSRFQQAAPNTREVTLDKGIEMIQSRHQHGTHSHSTKDPHYWLLPENLAIMAETMSQELSALFPDKEIIFKENLIILQKELRRCDSLIKENLSQSHSKAFMIYHPSLSYFAKHYGLKQIPLEQEGKEPSVKYMKSFLIQAQKQGLKNIFIQKGFDISKAEAISDETEGMLELIDPLAYDIPSELIRISTLIAKN